jgi:hypothetical protein
MVSAITKSQDLLKGRGKPEVSERELQLIFERGDPYREIKEPGDVAFIVTTEGPDFSKPYTGKRIRQLSCEFASSRDRSAGKSILIWPQLLTFVSCSQMQGGFLFH